MNKRAWDVGLPLVALVLLAAGAYVGLFVAPIDRMMGDVYRIMFVHVPAAWLALVAYTTSLVACVWYLVRADMRADAVAEACAEVGVVLNAILLATGSIWGRPTWGVWWTWDPRLTTAAIMLCAYAGYLALRQFVDEPERRATWAAVVGIVVYADIPLVWYSVKVWNSLHQTQSTPQTIPDPMMKAALRLSAFAYLFIFFWFARLRYDVARQRQRLELAEPPEAA